ncbi:hypothetical protein [Endozoicomonas sp. ISHI1]|uniref:hypothetical protein n=1 Tax=Endozoicomonas sp. ISHI1 TaxID=2825882 RepID=UPI0021483613|nr:hypothetical protein [Endozoicomonas sp. ISHI1]
MTVVKQLSLSLDYPGGELVTGDPIESKSIFCSPVMARLLERNNLVPVLSSFKVIKEPLALMV